jgi:hypothetical protein
LIADSGKKPMIPIKMNLPRIGTNNHELSQELKSAALKAKNLIS